MASRRSRNSIPKTETGIPGLDEILGGGLINGGLYVVTGETGTGKTILACHIAFNWAARGKRTIFYALHSEPSDRMLEYLHDMHFIDETLVPGPIRFVDAFETMETGGLTAVFGRIEDSVTKEGYDLIVIDCLYLSTWELDGGAKIRRFFHAIQSKALRVNCTIIFITNGALAVTAPERTMADGLVELTQTNFGNRSVRQIQAWKQRGGGHLYGTHVCRITDDGFTVWPRFEAIPSEPLPLPDRSNERLPSGIRDLDDMIGGGFPRRSTTLVAGPFGSGKTSLGLLFLAASTPEEPGVLVSYEGEEMLFDKAASLGFDLHGKCQSGAVQILQQNPSECYIDEMGQDLVDLVSRMQARRVFIDDANSLRYHSNYRERLYPFLDAISAKMRELDAETIISVHMNSILNMAINEDLFESIYSTNAILLTIKEENFEIVRSIFILKMAGGKFDAKGRTIYMGDQGICLLAQQGAGS